MEERKCEWRRLNDDRTQTQICVICSSCGLFGVVLAPLFYDDAGFVFEWPLVGLILGIGSELVITWFAVFSAAQINFANWARHRSLTPQERALLPGPSKNGLLWGLPVALYLVVWLTLLALQGEKLATPGVQGSVVCLLPTLAVVLMHLVPVSACWLWSYWGMFYRLGRNIPPYKELYGRIIGSNGQLYGGLSYDNSV